MFEIDVDISKKYVPYMLAVSLHAAFRIVSAYILVNTCMNSHTELKLIRFAKNTHFCRLAAAWRTACACQGNKRRGVGKCGLIYTAPPNASACSGCITFSFPPSSSFF